MPNYSDMTTAELHDELEARKLPKSGNKAELIERLEQADAQPAATGPQDQSGGEVGGQHRAGAGAPTADPDNPSNVTVASQGEKRQADKEINQDPLVGAVQPPTSDDAGIGEGSAANLGARTIDADAGDDEVTPRGEVDADAVDNGGIQRTSFGQQHAEILQGLSDERRQQQLEAAKGKSEPQADES